MARFPRRRRKGREEKNLNEAGEGPDARWELAVEVAFSRAHPQAGPVACQVRFLSWRATWRKGQETLALGRVCSHFLLLSRASFSPRFGHQGNMPHWDAKRQAELTFLSSQIPKWLLREDNSQIKQPVTSEIIFFLRYAATRSEP